MELFTRYNKNPILRPEKINEWESKAVFNCGIVNDDDKVHMFYRAVGEYEKYVSRIGYAISSDGFYFERNSHIKLPITEDYEKYGMEDPRISKIGDQVCITYVVLSGYVSELPKVSSALAITKDYNKFYKLGIITPKHEDNKDIVFFPEIFNSNNPNNNHKNGKYFSLHRPSGWTGPSYGTTKPSIWLRSGSTLTRSEDATLLLKPEQPWENSKIGAGPPPIKTDKGWLVIYHGVNLEKIYRVGAVMLDLRNPAKVIARTVDPIFEPKETYEKFGDVNNVVFPTGTATRDGKLFLYYGAADKVCCVATTYLDYLVEFLLENCLINYD